MKVRELVTLLQCVLDQDATVVIGEGSEPDVWLPVIGLVPRQISPVNDDDDQAGPGSQPAIEIV